MPSEKRFTRTLLCIAAVAAVAGCGGGDSSLSYEDLVAAAHKHEIAALAFSQDLSCTHSSQCAVLLFSPTVAICTPYRYAPLSLTSSGASAAVSEAAIQRNFAEQALAMSTQPVPTCAIGATLEPVPACNSNKCTLAYGQ